MNKIVLGILLFTTLFLSACTKSTSIGIMGGADEPTETIITNNQGEPVKTPIRMIKVEGKLYYDSGKTCDYITCGTLDGNLTKVGKEYEIPKNDNECNFNGGKGYQNFSSIAKVVPVNKEWVLFKLFDDPELDMSIFKYCFYLKGNMPKSDKENEIVVLTEDIDYNYEDHTKLLNSQQKITDRKYRTTFTLYGNYDEWGIQLSPKNVTNTGLTLVCEQFGGTNIKELQTGEAFSLFVQKDNEWIPVNTNPLIDYAWNMVAYSIQKNDITELEVNWEWLYGKLPAGFYRLDKEIMNFRESGDFDKKIYQLYFSIQ